jgi:hypothetical protein
MEAVALASEEAFPASCPHRARWDEKDVLPESVPSPDQHHPEAAYFLPDQYHHSSPDQLVHPEEGQSL